MRTIALLAAAAFAAVPMNIGPDVAPPPRFASSWRKDQLQAYALACVKAGNESMVPNFPIGKVCACALWWLTDAVPAELVPEVADRHFVDDHKTPFFNGAAMVAVRVCAYTNGNVPSQVRP